PLFVPPTAGTACASSSATGSPSTPCSSSGNAALITSMSTLIRNKDRQGRPSSDNPGGFAVHARDEATVELVGDNTEAEFDGPPPRSRQSFLILAKNLPQ